MTGASGRFIRFLGWTALIVGILLAIGFLPTRRLAGENGPAAMIAGCVIGFVSAALAGGLLVTVAGDTPNARMQRSFMAMVVRLAVVVVFGAAAVLSGEFARMPLLFWLATTYVAVLPLEVKLAITA